MSIVFSWFNVLRSSSSGTISRLEGHKGCPVSYNAVVRNIYVDIIKQCLLTLKDVRKKRKKERIQFLKRVWHFINTNMTLN